MFNADDFADWHKLEFGRRPALHEIQELYPIFESQFLNDMAYAEKAKREKYQTLEQQHC